MNPTPWRYPGGWGTSGSEAFKDKRDCDPANPRCSTRMYLESAGNTGCCVTMIHDGSMSQGFIDEHRTKLLRFLQVDISKLDIMFARKFGLNDARYFPIYELVCGHKRLQKVFFTDVFDVRVGSSPCLAAQPG